MTVVCSDSEESGNPPTLLNVFPGISLSINPDCAADYLSMRSAQLVALTDILASEQFTKESSLNNSNLFWLLSSLTHEVNGLIPIAIREAESPR